MVSIRVMGLTLSDILTIIAIFSAMVGVFRFIVISPIRKDINTLSENISSLNGNLDRLEQEDRRLTDRIHSLEVDIGKIKQQIKTLFSDVKEIKKGERDD